MTMKEEYTAIDMATAAADGFRDGQRAALDHSAHGLDMVGALATALDGLLSITQNSAGVAGYHLNGNVAEWVEFPEVDTAHDVLRLCREQPSAAQSAPAWVPDGESIRRAAVAAATEVWGDGECEWTEEDDLFYPAFVRILLNQPATQTVKAEQVQCLTCNDTAMIGDLPIECPDCCIYEATAPAHPAERQEQGEVQRLREALEFYARGDHLILFDSDEWDTCSGEPLNWLHDNAGTAIVEDGSLAKAALAASTGQEVGK